MAHLPQGPFCSVSQQTMRPARLTARRDAHVIAYVLRELAATMPVGSDPRVWLDDKATDFACAAPAILSLLCRGREHVDGNRPMLAVVEESEGE